METLAAGWRRTVRDGTLDTKPYNRACLFPVPFHCSYPRTQGATLKHLGALLWPEFGPFWAELLYTWGRPRSRRTEGLQVVMVLCACKLACAHVPELLTCCQQLL